MLMKPAIIKEQQQSEFVCSACGAARDCKCNAPALERLAAKDEGSRQRQKAYRERKAALHNAPVEITDEFEPEPEASAEARKAHYRDQVSPEQLDAMIRGAGKKVTSVTGGIRLANGGKPMPVEFIIKPPISVTKSPPYEIVRLTRAGHYLEVAQQSEAAANWNLEIKFTKEHLDAVDAVISAWTKLRRDLIDAGVSYRPGDDNDAAKA